MYYSDGIFTSAYKELREGIAAKGGVIAKGAAPAAKKEDPKAKGGEEKGANTTDEDRVKQALYDIRYRAKREGVPVAQAMTDYLKHSGSLGPKARAELKKKLMGEEVEQIDEISSHLALTASQKADEERRKAAVAGDRDRAASKAAQASRLYKGVGPRKARERVKEETEQVDELYKGKHGQSEKEYQDSRSDGGKMVSGDSKRSGAAYSSRATKNTGPNPAGGSKKPQGQGRMTSGARADLQYRKANLMKKEEVEVTEGLKQARKNVGMDPNKPSCWKGYKASGTKMKGGKEVPDCQKEETEQQLQRQQLQINRKKLQLQTKATQKNQKTDMSMRREEVSTEELLNLYNILENETLSYMHDIAEARVEEILTEESSTQKKGRGGETLYKVRVINNDGRSEVRYASRSKISELRSNSNIKSVEITGYGDAYNEKPKSKGGEKKLDPVGKEDGDVDNDGDKDKSDKYLLNRRKAIGKAMAKEEYVDEGIIDAAKAGSKRHQDAMKGASRAIKKARENTKKLGKALAPAADTAKSAASGVGKAVKGTYEAGKKTGEFVKKGAQRHSDMMKAAKKVFNKEELELIAQIMIDEGYNLSDYTWEEFHTLCLDAEMLDENRAAARAAGGSKDDSKKQPDPSKPGFTGMGNMSIDQIRKMSARIEKEKSAKK